MADFGDPSLFEEFDKEPAPSDRLLLNKFKDDLDPKDANSLHDIKPTNKSDDEGDNGAPISHIRFVEENESDVDSESRSAKAEFMVGSDDDDSDREDFGDFDNGDDDSNSVEHMDEDSQDAGTRHAHMGDKCKGCINLRNVRRENQRLKSRLRVADPTAHFCDGSGPAVEVVFLNHTFSRIFRHDIETFITERVMGFNRMEQTMNPLPELPLRDANIALSMKADGKLMADHQDVMKHMTASTVLGCSQFYQEFKVDALGWNLVEKTPALTDSWVTPVYEQVFKSAIPCDSEDEEDDLLAPPKHHRPKASCFNCGEDHQIRECPIPKDQQRIAKNRRTFQDAMAAVAPMKSVRYHIDEVNNQKKSRFAPGVISDELRDALGLHAGQLAPYTYQMRKLGYPPGWLQEAAVTGSGLQLFDKHGQGVDVPSGGRREEEEEGEISQSAVQYDKVEYNISKIIDYPGFNIPLEEGMIDECHQYGMPPMQHHHSKEFLVSNLTPVSSKSSRSKRILSDDSCDQKPKKRKSDYNVVDMDLDTSTEAKQSKMSTLDDIESETENVQQQLDLNKDDTDNSLEDLVDTDRHSSSAPPLPPTPEQPPLPPGTPPITPSTPRRPLDLVPSGGSIELRYGTPIVNRISCKTESLPNAEKWQKDIVQHIPYENLPGATGTFEKLRKTLHHIHSVKDLNKN